MNGFINDGNIKAVTKPVNLGTSPGLSKGLTSDSLKKHRVTALTRGFSRERNICHFVSAVYPPE